jgi:hypothetical protein
VIVDDLDEPNPFAPLKGGRGRSVVPTFGGRVLAAALDLRIAESLGDDERAELERLRLRRIVNG